MDIDDILYRYQTKGNVHLDFHKAAAGGKCVVLALVSDLGCDMYGTVQGIEGGVRYHGQVEEHGLPAAYHNLTVFYVQHIR